MRVVEAEAAQVAPGGTTTLRALIANYGPDPTDANFAVKVRIPARVTPVGPYFPGDCRPDPAEANGLDCTFDTGLPLLRTAVLEIPVQVDGGVLGGQRLDGGLVTVYDPDHPDISHSRAFAVQTN
ncbi:hypothetical protein GCM10009738_32700 [Kitasatospora viridis]|uniref:DUF11 domain-containing protein n=1 Tax=Kitasatospora viridis TaxID=281105 RepID=A0A561UQF8_9ACTN|nr:hypothetical protein FHX73_115497 [Kitasatospora viridis]